MGRRSPGEGSVFRRKSDGAWMAQVSVGPREDRCYRSRSAKTRADAVRKLRDLQAEMRTGVDPSRLTTGAYLEQWVSDARNIKATTRAGYADVVTHHLVPAIGHVRLQALTPSHVERLLADLEGTVSPKYARNIHATLRRALGQAVRTGLVSRNVAAREFVDAPRVTPSEPEALSVGEVERLRSAWADDRLAGLFEVAVRTGLRMGELLGLSWSDVAGAELQVRKELARINGRYVLLDPKTASSVRRIPMTPELRVAIAAHRDRVKADGFVPTATGPVFTNTQGKPLNGSWVTHHFYGLCREAGIERHPFKILRATFSTRLHEAGVSDTVIAALMGHTRTHTTRRHYIATSDADLELAMGKVG
jgi:integrase